MASFIFKWEHPASEVYVTGTFDDWSKSEKLEKVGDHFQKSVTLPDSSSKIFYKPYNWNVGLLGDVSAKAGERGPGGPHERKKDGHASKFVVDGEWVIDPTATKEADASGNENNVLTPELIVADAPATTAIMSSTAPESTTAALAGAVPLEKKEESAADLPGAFPETPAGEVGINPMPAAAGALNPIQLAPGEKIPDSVTAESTTSNVKLDPESYEKSDSLPGGASVFTSSAAPEATTAQLAGAVPLEPKVPDVVKESQEKAGVSPEASANTEEVKEKAAVESELKERLTEAPTTSEGTAGKGMEKSETVVTPGEAAATVVAAASAAGAAAVAGTVAAKDALLEKVTGTSAETTEQQEEAKPEVSPEVPVEVKQSIAAAAKDPEAAANTEAVEDKKAVEAELAKEVKPVEAEAAPVVAVALKAEEAPKTEEPSKSEDTAAEETKPETNGSQTAPIKTAEAAPASEKPVASPTTDKKKNRLSTIIGKIKEKIHHK